MVDGVCAEWTARCTFQNQPTGILLPTYASAKQEIVECSIRFIMQRSVEFLMGWEYTSECVHVCIY